MDQITKYSIKISEFSFSSFLLCHQQFSCCISMIALISHSREGHPSHNYGHFAYNTASLIKTYMR